MTMRERGNCNRFIPHLPQLATLTGRTNDNLVSTAIFSMIQSKLHVYLVRCDQLFYIKDACIGQGKKLKFLSADVFRLIILCTQSDKNI